MEENQVVLKNNNEDFEIIEYNEHDTKNDNISFEIPYYKLFFFLYFYWKIVPHDIIDKINYIKNGYLKYKFLGTLAFKIWNNKELLINLLT